MSFKKDEMLIMPAVDIKNGKCVQLVQGEPGSEMVEIENHPFFIASQFHPEFKSRPDRPQPLFVGLISVAKKNI